MSNEFAFSLEVRVTGIDSLRDGMAKQFAIHPGEILLTGWRCGQNAAFFASLRSE